MAKKDEKKGELTNEHDKFVKVALGITEVMADYLNNFMPAELLDYLDISTLERVEESSITDELSEFFADLIWKLKFKNGTDLEIGILVEHKSWRPLYPHFQPLEYMIGRWRNKRKAMGHKSKQRELYAHEIIELEAKEEGRQEERKKTVIKLWQNGIDISMISNITDMPIEQIEQLIADFRKNG